MSEDTFFREVNEEIRQERAKRIWDSFGPFIILGAVLVVLGTAGFVAWDYFASARAAKSGDAFAEALTLAQSGKSDEALAAFQKLEQEGSGSYAVLARMRAAPVLGERQDFAGAVAGFDGVAADARVPQAIRDMARLRAGLLLVDHGAYADVASRVEALADDTNPLRFSARETLGLAAWKANRAPDALKLFDQIRNDSGSPADMRQRAGLMAELIRGSGAAS